MEQNYITVTLCIAVRSLNCHTTTGTHMPHGITLCYLPPGRGDRAFSKIWYLIKQPHHRYLPALPTLTQTKEQTSVMSYYEHYSAVESKNFTST